MRFLALCFLMLFSAVGTLAQSTVKMLRTDFEEGVSYLNEPIATVSFSGKPADDFSGIVDWGDGNPNQNLRTSAVSHVIFYNGMNRTVVDPGEYYIFANEHVYKGVGKHRLVIHRNLHHLDDTGAGRQDFPAEITVHSRRPIQDLSAANKSVKGGDPFEITLVITQNASPANARIHLTWDPAGSAALAAPPPSYAEIPTNNNSVTIKVDTKKTKVPHVITLTATSVGTPKVLRLRVTPSAP